MKNEKNYSTIDTIPTYLIKKPKNDMHAVNISRDPVLSRSYRLWSNMHYRVSHIPSYSDTKICERWYKFSSFARDIKKIPNYEQWLCDEEMELDKDIRCSLKKKKVKIYSPSTCMFVSKGDNLRQAHNTSFILKDLENGSVHIFPSEKKACEFLGVSYSTISVFYRTVKNRTYKSRYKIYKKDEIKII